MTTRKPWTDNENAALATLYFTMLDAAIAGKPYNKAQLIRKSQEVSNYLDAPLFTRSRGSIEAKLMNASACHVDLVRNATTMDGYGYRALSNYQKSLKSAMAEALIRRSSTAYIDNSGMFCNHGQAFPTAIEALSA